MQRQLRGGIRGCFSGGTLHVGPMSLNRCEQRVFDYLRDHPDERHYWISKVQSICRSAENDPAAAGRLEPELWRYVVERSNVASPFKEAARDEGLKRTSMKNLAELMIRLWVEPRPKKKTAPVDS